MLNRCYPTIMKFAIAIHVLYVSYYHITNQTHKYMQISRDVVSWDFGSWSRDFSRTRKVVLVLRCKVLVLILVLIKKLLIFSRSW